MQCNTPSAQTTLRQCHRAPYCRSRHRLSYRCGSTRNAPPQQHPDSQKPAKSSVDGGGAAEGLGKASPDVLRLFSETQRNLLELNRSRLSALDELRVARSKITDLEGKLQKATHASVDDAPDSNRQSDHASGQQQGNTAAPPSQQAVNQNVITIAYETGWSRVMMHYSSDGQTWTNLPGVEMQSGSHNLSGSKVLQVRGNQIEFVLNDGAGQWDTPDPYGSSQNKNYQVDAPGKYRLQGGKLERLG